MTATVTWSAATEESVLGPVTWIKSSDGRHIAVMSSADPKDAVLVVAAPQMYESLKAMVAVAELNLGFMREPPNADGPLIQARAAIAAAEGRTS